MRWTASRCCGHCCYVRVTAIQAGSFYGVCWSCGWRPCVGEQGSLLGFALLFFFSFYPDVWSSERPHFQVVLATELTGEEGPLLLELRLGKHLRNKHGSDLSTTATVVLTKPTRCQETGAVSSCRISGEVWKFPHKNFQIKYKRMILKERKIKLALMTLGGCFPNTGEGNYPTNRKERTQL